jgi:lipoate-protein ligase B
MYLSFATASKRIKEEGLTGVWVNTGQPRISVQQGLDQAITQAATSTNQDMGRDSKIAAIGIKLRR